MLERKAERRLIAERATSEPLERVLARMSSIGAIDAEFRTGRWTVTWWPSQTLDPLPCYVGESKLLVVAARRAVRQWAMAGRR